MAREATMVSFTQQQSSLFVANVVGRMPVGGSR